MCIMGFLMYKLGTALGTFTHTAHLKPTRYTLSSSLLYRDNDSETKLSKIPQPLIAELVSSQTQQSPYLLVSVVRVIPTSAAAASLRTCYKCKPFSCTPDLLNKNSVFLMNAPRGSETS